MAVAAPLLVRAGLPRLQRWLEPPPSLAALGSPESDRVASQYARWVDAVIRRGRPLVRPGCLTRGITLYYSLRRAGVAVALCFGIGSDEGTTAAHCWLEIDDRPVLELADPRSKFTEVVRLSRDGVTH